jgi:hypothetical protein
MAAILITCFKDGERFEIGELAAEAIYTSGTRRRISLTKIEDATLLAVLFLRLTTSDMPHSA